MYDVKKEFKDAFWGMWNAECGKSFGEKIRNEARSLTSGFMVGSSLFAVAGAGDGVFHALKQVFTQQAQDYRGLELGIAGAVAFYALSKVKHALEPHN